MLALFDNIDGQFLLYLAVTRVLLKALVSEHLLQHVDLLIQPLKFVIDEGFVIEVGHDRCGLSDIM